LNIELCGDFSAALLLHAPHHDAKNLNETTIIFSSLFEFLLMPAATRFEPSNHRVELTGQNLGRVFNSRQGILVLAMQLHP
jgi:hypothetical protein